MTTTEPYVIRPFAARDRDALNACIRELQEHERRIEPRMKRPDEIVAAYLDTLLAACTEKAGSILVAERDGTVVGYTCVYAREPNDDPDEIDYDYAYVADVAVGRAHRGQGIGGALLAAAEAHALDHDARWLRISALAANTGAVSLYERSGFAPRVVELEKPLAPSRQ